jgi:hypothetical protein
MPASILINLPTKLEGLRVWGLQRLSAAEINAINALPSDVFERLEHLKRLSIKQCDLSDRFVEHLPPSITYLDLSGNLLTDASIRRISSLPLTFLDVSEIYRLTDGAFSLLPQTITDLRISGCPLLTGAVCALLPRNLKQLLMHVTELIAPDSFAALPRTLSDLCLSRCYPGTGSDGK